MRLAIDGAQQYLDLLRSFLEGGPVLPTTMYGREHLKLVKNMLVLRRKRADFFGADLFSDPAWDILLELYETQLTGRRIAVSALAAVIDVPATTVLRWVTNSRARGG